MTEDNLRAVMALADAYALTGYSAVSLTLAQAMPQRAALESALRAMPAQALAPLTDANIQQQWEATFSTNNPFCPCDLRSFTKASRAIERAHGIGAEVAK